MGYSASGCRPTGQSSSLLVELWQPQVGSLWDPAKGQWLQGGVLAMAEERVPPHTRMSSGCFITSTNIHWPEQVTWPSPISVGKEGATFCLQGKGEGEYLPSKQTFAELQHWYFLKRSHVTLIFSQGSESLTYSHTACQPVKMKIRLS